MSNVVRTISRFHDAPNRNRIAERIMKRFNDSLYRPLVNVAAEECERIILEITRPHITGRGEFAVRIVKKCLPGKTIRYFKSNYHCPACGFDKVHTDHKHCPECCMLIKWETPISKKDMRQLLEEIKK